MYCLQHKDVLEILPERSACAHKGDFGKMLLLCGSRGYTGAAALAAMGALRSGGGLIYLGVPESIYSIEAVKLTEPLVFPLPDSQGMLSEEAVQHVAERLDGMDALLIGPGLGQSSGTLAVLEYVMSHFRGPVVVDADGLNMLSMHKNIVRRRTGITVITPHEGEFKRLGGSVGADRKAAAEVMARDFGCIVVLKGHGTVITDGSHTYLNTTGNPGMAVGGCGDILAGMITSFLAQGISPLEASAIGAWLHGAAGDACAQQMGQYGMLPSDMLEVLPRLMK